MSLAELGPKCWNMMEKNSNLLPKIPPEIVQEKPNKFQSEMWHFLGGFHIPVINILTQSEI